LLANYALREKLLLLMLRNDDVRAAQASGGARMIYVTSFFDLEGVDWRKVHTIALTVPSGLTVARRVPCLFPTWDMVRDFKAGRITEKQYTAKYRELMLARWPRVKRWLRNLPSDQDIYLCCWERTGFCHRYLVAKLIRKFRPDLEVRVS
jgi:hypothetical protein